MRRDLDEPRRQRLDADERRPEGAEFGERWHCDGGCTNDERDDIVEIVVIPITADPRRVGWGSVGGRHQSQQGGDEEDDAGLLKHAV